MLIDSKPTSAAKSIYSVAPVSAALLSAFKNPSAPASGEKPTAQAAGESTITLAVQAVRALANEPGDATSLWITGIALSWSLDGFYAAAERSSAHTGST